ncbi:MAG: AAA family ATPase [Spirochaetia bacterium]|nr:AAA family ATPase [Spirochaetia bacterium]
MQYYPKKMMIEFTELDQESVRSMFRSLFDENKSLEERINTFIEKSDEFLSYLNKMKPQEKERKQHYHKDVRAIALYLTFRYPGKYYLYKFRETKQFLSQFTNQTLSMGWEPAEKYSFYLRNANELRDILTADKSLVETYEKWLKDNDFIDPNYTFLTQDFLFQTTYKDWAEEIEKTSVKIETTKNEAVELPSKNVIYYGPPGTGKTYFLRNQLIKQYSEERPIKSKEEQLQTIASKYSWWQIVGAALLELGKAHVAEIVVHRLVQSKNEISNQKNTRAMVWAMLQMHTVTDCEHVNYTRRAEPLFFYKEKDSVWSIREEIVKTEVPELYQILEEEEKSQNEEIQINRYDFITFHQAYSYEDFVEGIRPMLSQDSDEQVSGELGYVIKPGIFKQIVEKAKQDKDQKYALLIDEINRANVSEVFGELITLIEDDKRLKQSNSMQVKLPYSEEMFGIPNNLDIIGTMNTADRSVEALDTALRRRFSFIEMEPDPTLLAESPHAVEEIELDKLLSTINARIEKLLNRDYRIGHGYFTNIYEQEELEEGLRIIFKHKIIPLLQEYFYDDWGKIGLVLGKDFIRREHEDITFAEFDDDTYEYFEEKSVYRIH